MYRPQKPESFDSAFENLLHKTIEQGVVHVRMQSHKDAMKAKDTLSRLMRGLEYHQPQSYLAIQCKRVIVVVRNKTLLEVLQRDKAPPMWVWEADIIRLRSGGKGSYKRQYNDKRKKAAGH